MKHEITAIIYDKRGNILSIGKNSYVKTHTVQAKFAQKAGNSNAVFLHAEIAAIIKCKNIDKAHKMAVYRFHKNGTPAKATPCKICQMAISELTQIKVIEHT